jgi:hypothetical protein
LAPLVSFAMPYGSDKYQRQGGGQLFFDLADGGPAQGFNVSFSRASNIRFVRRQS